MRHLERAKLRMPYPEVVARIRAVAMDAAMGARRCVVVDATGVGAPVVDLLLASKMDCEIVPVVITGGEAAVRVGAEWQVPKRDLVAGLQLMFDSGELRISAKLAEAEVLKRELMGMSLKRSVTGREWYGWAHDDLVLALALACWRAKVPGRWNWFGRRPDGRG